MQCCYGYQGHEVTTGTWNSGLSNMRDLWVGGFFSALNSMVKDSVMVNYVPQIKTCNGKLCPPDQNL